VEDNESQAEILQVAFQDHGYQVDVARTGREAEAKFQAGAYEIVILDHHLPDTQGDKLLVTFRQKRPDTVYLAMTGDAHPDLALLWMNLGAAAFVSKPFSPPYLIELCAKARRERDLLRIEDRLEARTRELRHSEERFTAFMTHLPAAAFVKDQAGRTLFANPYLQNLLSFVDWEGKTTPELVAGDIGQQMAVDDRKALEQGPLKVMETITDGQGTLRTFETIKFPIRVEGKPALLGGISTDITDLKRAEEEKEKLEAQNRHLHKTESLGRMAGAIAHHFNNQLQVVMMDLDFALRSESPGNVAAGTLSDAMEAARKAAEVSSLMLTYLGQAQGKRVPVNLTAACLRNLSLLRAAIPQDVALETDLPTPGPVISADSNQLQQVLTNLVTNAWEASGEKRGSIRVRVKTVASAEISGMHRFPIDWQAQTQTYACLEVADHGSGIAEKDIEKIFDPFYSSKFTGRGLGLSVVYGIVQAHKGVITVESKLGWGSILRAFFPVTTEMAPPAAKPVPQPADLADGCTVLLVEDEPSVRTVLALQLQNLGFTVLAAANGCEAVEQFQRHAGAIHLVLCDLVMPLMNGWETLTALRKLSPDLPVILSSGYSEAQAMNGHHTELPQAFLGKPYLMDELRDTIARVLEQAKRKA
jgi:PAS domain S-box-containing protein